MLLLQTSHLIQLSQELPMLKTVLRIFFVCDFFQSRLYILKILFKSSKSLSLRMSIILETGKLIWKQVLWKRRAVELSNIKKKFKFAHNLKTQGQPPSTHWYVFCQQVFYVYIFTQMGHTIRIAGTSTHFFVPQSIFHYFIRFREAK